MTTGQIYPDDFEWGAARDVFDDQSLYSRASSLKVAGFTVVPMETYFSQDGFIPKCDVASWEPHDRMTFAYLPPGTSLESPQHDALCPDGSLLFTSQAFRTIEGNFLVTYSQRPPIIGSSANADYVREAQLDKGSGVSILAPGPQGFGLSTVAYHTDRGFVLIEAYNLPKEELYALAGGIECEGC